MTTYCKDGSTDVNVERVVGDVELDLTSIGEFALSLCLGLVLLSLCIVLKKIKKGLRNNITAAYMDSIFLLCIYVNSTRY